MKSCKVSIIVPVFNGSFLISRCLDSIFTQIGNFKIEVIVIDDGSTDNTLKILENYKKPITILKQVNNGPAAARNEGIKISTGKYLTFLDADDYWQPAFLKETISFLDDNNDAISVSVGQAHKFYAKTEKILPNFLNEENSNFKEPVVLNDFYAFWANHNHVCTGSVLLRTDIVKQTGGQRSDLRITEDLEFWAYLATFGKWGFIPKVLFVSDGGKVTREIGWFKKNQKRWASAPTVKIWESRIIKRISNKLLPSYDIAKGRIAKNLAYSMILSKRINLSRKTIIKYKHLFPKDKLSLCMSFFANYKFIFIFFSKIMFVRERYRKL
tara:strand:- start:217 stop:1194 length:978 start_codon:yes stop_codon:yes gene_type:complete